MYNRGRPTCYSAIQNTWFVLLTPGDNLLLIGTSCNTSWHVTYAITLMININFHTGILLFFRNSMLWLDSVWPPGMTPVQNHWQ